MLLMILIRMREIPIILRPLQSLSVYRHNRVFGLRGLQHSGQCQGHTGGPANLTIQHVVVERNGIPYNVSLAELLVGFTFI